CGFRLSEVFISPIARVDVIVKIDCATQQSSANRRLLARLSCLCDFERCGKQSCAHQGCYKSNKECPAIPWEMHLDPPRRCKARAQFGDINANVKSVQSLQRT